MLLVPIKYCMEFKKWLEMGHIVMDRPVANIEMIDFRFEDYMPKLGNFTPVLARLPFGGNQWVVKDPSSDSSISPLNTIQIANLIKKGFVKLPDEWWEYAQVHYQDGTIKPGKKES